MRILWADWLRLTPGVVDDGVEGVRELLLDPRGLLRGRITVGMPLRMEVVDGVRDDGKEDKEVCRFRLLCELPLPDVPFVDGLWGSIVAIEHSLKTGDLGKGELGLAAYDRSILTITTVFNEVTVIQSTIAVIP